MTSRSDIVAAARSYLGVRFRHQGRSRERGIDCCGLIVLVGRDVGVFEPAFDFQAYARHPDGFTMREKCDEHLEVIPWSAVGAGDVLLFKGTALPCHLAIVTSVRGSALRVVHSYAPYRKVVENGLPPAWHAELCGCYRYPGIT